LRQRNHQNLAERAARAGDPHRHATLLGRSGTAHGRQDDAEGGAGDADADQKTHADDQHQA
jgi:hypothetical protein